MRHVQWMMMVAGAMLIACTAIAQEQTTFSIPADQVDVQKVFFGKVDAFAKPAKVDYETVVKATPEYAEVQKKRIRQGTGKYWILMSKASDRAVRAIAEVGQEKSYDLIAAQGYLGGLEPAIPSDDVTEFVLAKIAPKKEAKGRKGLLPLPSRT